MNVFILLGGVWTWTVVFAASVLTSAVILLIAPFVRLADPTMKACHRIGILWAHGVVFLVPWWRFRIDGRGNLPGENEAVVYVANHQSQLDIFALYLLRRQFRWIAKASLFRTPLVGPAMRACRYVPVERNSNDSRRRSLAAARAHLREGTSMAFFPEGTRSKGGKLQPFKRGAFALAAELGRPVVPVAISGTERILPAHSYLPRAAKVSIQVLPPIYPRGRHDDSEWLAEQAVRAIAEATGRAPSLKSEIPFTTVETSP